MCKNGLITFAALYSFLLRSILPSNFGHTYMQHEDILKQLSNSENIVKKHSVFLSGHATSVTLEDIFWKALKSIAQKQNRSLSQLITEIDNYRSIPLSSALRLYVLHYYI